MLMAELDFDEPVVVDDGLDPVSVGDEPVVLEPEEGEDEFEGGVPSAEEALAVAWNASNVLF
jgi:hypothetical protein